MQIIKIEPKRQVNAIEHKSYFEGWPEAHDRMVRGTKKYGKSWCEVDLRSDLIEELMDVYNYAELIRLRLKEQVTLVLPTAEQDKLLTEIKNAARVLTNRIEEVFPEFEGPTSNQWVGDGF